MSIRRVIFNFFWTTERIFSANPPFFIFVILLYLVTFLLLLPIVCWRLPYSCFMSVWMDHQMNANRLVKLNALNYDSAQKYIRKADHAQDMWNANGNRLGNSGDPSELDLIIGIVTVKRMYGDQELGYLTQVVEKFHKIFADDKIYASKALFICDVYPGPGQHEEAIRLGRYFKRIVRYPNGSVSASIKDPFEREKDDYEYCLRRALEQNPKLVMLVEDDTVPRPDLFKVINYKLRRDLGSSSNVLGYLKLYYPERWQGFGFEFNKIMELMLCGVAGGVVFFSVSSLHSGVPVSKRRCRSIKSFIFAIGAVYLILVALVIGRQHVLELRRFSETFYTLANAPKCCTPAVLYPSESASILAAHLSTVSCNNGYPLDFAMEAFMEEARMDRYLVEPNLFKHIGLISSTKGISRDIRDFIFALQ